MYKKHQHLFFLLLERHLKKHGLGQMHKMSDWCLFWDAAGGFGYKSVHLINVAYMCLFIWRAR